MLYCNNLAAKFHFRALTVKRANDPKCSAKASEDLIKGKECNILYLISNQESRIFHY